MKYEISGSRSKIARDILSLALLSGSVVDPKVGEFSIICNNVEYPCALLWHREMVKDEWVGNLLVLYFCGIPTWGFRNEKNAMEFLGSCRKGKH